MEQNFALNSNFDKELPSLGYGWETYEADGFTLDPDGQKHKHVLEANSKAMRLLVALAKGVNCQNIINQEKQADSKFLTGRAVKL